MLTILEAVNSAAEYLNKKNIKSARLNAELLLAHVLNLKRMQLYLSYDTPLKKNEIDLYRELLLRRSKFEPLQYIIGKVEFYGLELEVNSSVLIPRPETELLVEEIINSYPKDQEINILEVGCGSGNISIALASNFTNSKIIAIDVSESAVELSNRNAKLNCVAEKISFVKEDIFNDLSENFSNFNIIVSNPPYVSSEDYNRLELELRLYEPQIALTDRSDGLTFYKRISEQSKFLLKQKGKIFFEIGFGQSDAVKKILAQRGFENIKIKKDYSGIDRIISGELN